MADLYRESNVQSLLPLVLYCLLPSELCETQEKHPNKYCYVKFPFGYIGYSGLKELLTKADLLRDVYKRRVVRNF